MKFLQSIIDAFVWVYVMILRVMSTVKSWFIVLIIFVGCSQPVTEPLVVQSFTESPCKLEKIVRCEECVGTGEVVYDENHLVVIHKLAEPGKYTCPICKGFGELIEEVR